MWDEKMAIALSLDMRVIVFLYVVIDNDLLCRGRMITPLSANEHNWIQYWNIGISFATQRIVSRSAAIGLCSFSLCLSAIAVILET